MLRRSVSNYSGGTIAQAVKRRQTSHPFRDRNPRFIRVNPHSEARITMPHHGHRHPHRHSGLVEMCAEHFPQARGNQTSGPRSPETTMPALARSRLNVAMLRHPAVKRPRKRWQIRRRRNFPERLDHLRTGARTDPGFPVLRYGPGNPHRSASPASRSKSPRFNRFSFRPPQPEVIGHEVNRRPMRPGQPSPTQAPKFLRTRARGGIRVPARSLTGCNMPQRINLDKPASLAPSKKRAHIGQQVV